MELDINTNHQEAPQEDAPPVIAYEEVVAQDTVRWANLLPEVCSMVLDRADAVNVIHFPVVCTHWAKASKQAVHRCRLPSGAATLLTSSLNPECTARDSDMESGAFGLHDVMTGGLHNVAIGDGGESYYGVSYYDEAEGL